MSRSFASIATTVFGLTLLASALSCDPVPTPPAPDAGPAIRCGGIAGFACPDKLLCVDDPSDDCDPKNGGADCGGICVTPGRCEASWADPARDYKGRSPEVCARIKFACPAGSAYFSDPCGCGCLRTGN